MLKNDSRFTKSAEKGKGWFAFSIFCLMWCLVSLLLFPHRVQGEEKSNAVNVEFFYENVCATCEGDADFYTIYKESITAKDRESLDTEVRTYNVFLDSCEEYYDAVKAEVGIPEGTDLPVLVIGNEWISGYDRMGEFLQEQLLGQASNQGKQDSDALQEMLPGEKESAITDGSEKREDTEKKIEEIIEQIQENESRVFLLFTTNSCEDCEQVEGWIRANEDSLDGVILAYNIIEDNCLELLKGMFREYEVEESEQVVPAIFVGDMALTSQARICSMDTEKVLSQSGNDYNRQLVQRMKNVQEQVKQEEGHEKNSVNLLTLAGAGLLAGLNPCSISMLLMLLSLILSEKASVWKNGLLYLLGKYGAYFAIGLGIYFTASQIPEQTLGKIAGVIDMILVILFVIAGILYLTDAVRVYHQDYGHIRTQLPVRLRRMNHRMIRRMSGKTGTFQPLLILGLGIAISLGEFFCTGQIYMATITYLLKDHISGVWMAFLVYVTAMSLPAFCMILLIQRTRNTEHVSDFMLRHMGVIKILNAVLFFGFAIYFLVR